MSRRTTYNLSVMGSSMAPQCKNVAQLINESIDMRFGISYHHSVIEFKM